MNNDLQNTTQKNKDRETQTPLKTGGELKCSGRVISFCSTCSTQCVTFVTNLVISHEQGKEQIMITTKGHIYSMYFIQHAIFLN
jgi:hypothetical protein